MNGLNEAKKKIPTFGCRTFDGRKKKRPFKGKNCKAKARNPVKNTP
jgi:hypothetical protein